MLRSNPHLIEINARLWLKQLRAKYSLPEMTLSAAGENPTQRFQLFLTYMGNPKLKFTQADVRASSISAASPGTVQLWSVRSEGYVEYSGSTTFLHRREAWLTMPPSAQQ